MEQDDSNRSIMEINLEDPSTKAVYEFYDESEKEDFVTSYFYMKYLYEYISLFLKGFGTPLIPSVEKLDPDILKKIKQNRKFVMERLGNSETSVYHSKVIQLKDAEQLLTQKVTVNIEVPETVIPFKLARKIIINESDTIAVGTCPCRFTNPECSCMPEPMEACIAFGDPHASFLIEHNPRFRKITRQTAIDILEDCHKRGFVHCAYFRKEMGNRLYAICNCCSCCCAGIKATNLFHDKFFPVTTLAPSGYVAQIGEDCNGCGECIDKCQFHAIRWNDDQTRAEVIFENCMGCGICERACPMGVITTQIEPSKGGILDLKELMKLEA